MSQPRWALNDHSSAGSTYFSSPVCPRKKKNHIVTPDTYMTLITPIQPVYYPGGKYYLNPIIQMGKLRQRKLKQAAQFYGASKWWSWDANPGHLALHSTVHRLCHLCQAPCCGGVGQLTCLGIGLARTPRGTEGPARGRHGWTDCYAR